MELHERPLVVEHAIFSPSLRRSTHLEQSRTGRSDTCKDAKRAVRHFPEPTRTDRLSEICAIQMDDDSTEMRIVVQTKTFCLINQPCSRWVELEGNPQIRPSKETTVT